MGESDKILLVDDDPMMLAGISLHLRDQYEIRTAESGEEAVEVLEQEDFALLITDLNMPGMTGGELVKHARRIAPATPRILLTGYADTRSAIAAINDGAVFSYLQKPCDIDILHRVVADGIELHHLMMRDPSALDDETERLSRELAENQRLAAVGSSTAAFGHRLQDITSVLKSALTHIREDSEQGNIANDEDLASLKWGIDSLGRYAQTLLKVGRSPTSQNRDVVLIDAMADVHAVLDLVAAFCTVDGDFPTSVTVVARREDLVQTLVDCLLTCSEAIQNVGGMVELTVRVRQHVPTKLNIVICSDKTPGLNLNEEDLAIANRIMSTSNGNVQLCDDPGRLVRICLATNWDGASDTEDVDDIELGFARTDIGALETVAADDR